MTNYLSAEAPCHRCRQPIGWCLDTCPEKQRPILTFDSYPDSVADGLTITGVIRAVEGSQSPVKARTCDTRVPVRYIVLLFLGLVLMGVGMAADPIGTLIYEVIPR